MRAIQKARMLAQEQAIEIVGLNTCVRQQETLVNRLLPDHIHEALKQSAADNSIIGIADNYKDVTIIFCDIVGFTTWSANMRPDDLLRVLGEVFSVFDVLAEKHGVEKIKTIGDAYMAVCGLPKAKRDHAERAAKMGFDMQEAIKGFRDPQGNPLQVRIGLHSGSVMAGVIGMKKLAFDIFGDAVNVASRMESHGIPGRIQCSEATYKLLNKAFRCQSRGHILIKGKGEQECFIVHRRNRRRKSRMKRPVYLHSAHTHICFYKYINMP